MRALSTMALVLLSACGSNQAVPAANCPCANNAPSSPPSTSTSPSTSTPTPTSTSTSPPTPTSASASTVDRTQKKLIEAINAGDAQAVERMFGPGMRKALPPEKLERWLPGVVAARGKLGEAEPVATEPRGERRATYRVKAERGDWWLNLTVDSSGTIIGLQFSDPPSADPPVTTNVALGLSIGLPFRTGGWRVLWGGSTEDVNAHVRMKSQRRAADLYIDNGGTHLRDGKDVRDYYAYGQEVVAVADGKVVYAVDGVPDSVPGVLNGYALIGNAVVLEHTPKSGKPIYSMVAHLAPGSVKVKPGATVKRGQVLGLCGNSGNSTEPHIHFQLMDGPRVEASFGIEAVFDAVTVRRAGGESKVVEGYTFLKDDLIANPPPR